MSRTLSAIFLALVIALQPAAAMLTSPCPGCGSGSRTDADVLAGLETPCVPAQSETPSCCARTADKAPAPVPDTKPCECPKSCCLALAKVPVDLSDNTVTIFHTLSVALPAFRPNNPSPDAHLDRLKRPPRPSELA